MKKSSVEKIEMAGFREPGFFNGLSGGNHDQKGAEKCPYHDRQKYVLARVRHECN